MDLGDWSLLLFRLQKHPRFGSSDDLGSGGIGEIPESPNVKMADYELLETTVSRG